MLTISSRSTSRHVLFDSKTGKLPLLAVVFYGLFNLGIVVHKVFNFRTYPSEQKSLLQDILRAKEALKGKGVFDDE